MKRKDSEETNRDFLFTVIMVVLFIPVIVLALVGKILYHVGDDICYVIAMSMASLCKWNGDYEAAIKWLEVYRRSYKKGESEESE